MQCRVARTKVKEKKAREKAKAILKETRKKREIIQKRVKAKENVKESMDYCGW